MQLLVCDSCGRPLSEGAVARGDAFERGNETICKACDTRAKAAKPAIPAASVRGPLAHYEQSVWKCQSCGIPVNAIDLIEGRAMRRGEEVQCSRCAQPAPAPVAETRAPEPVSMRAPRRSALHSVAASMPKSSASRSAVFVAEARKEERRPVLPIVLIAIVLPMFALSLWYAISTQQKLNEATAQAGNSEFQVPRAERPRESLDDGSANPRPANSETKPSPPPETPRNEAPVIPPAVLNELAGLEKDLAADSIKKLESRDLAVVWEGLIEAGSRRMIAARPWVRALLRDTDARTRALACRVCGLLSDSEALGTLDSLAQADPSADVRDAAHLARARLVGKATRELSDMKPEELEALRKQIEDELKRHKGGNSND